MMKLTLSTIAWGLALTASAQLTTPQIELPDPLLMNDGKTQVTELKDWKARRLEIADMIQTFGARKVWSQFGIADRIGYSINGGHMHCMLPESQYPEVEAFLDKFLLDKQGIDTSNILIAPADFKQVDLNKWIKY